MRAIFRTFFMMSWADAIRERDFAKIADWFIARFLTFGGFTIFLAGLAAWNSDPQIGGNGIGFGLKVLTLGAILAGACGMLGWLLGLIFGIPRSLARPQPNAAAGTSAPTPPPGAVSRVNTNLEDVSDWLSKTLIGVGLTQLTTLPRFIWHVGGAINANGFGWPGYGQALSVAIILYFLPGGFWLGYVGTRTILAQMFDDFAAGLPANEIAEAAAPENLRVENGRIKEPGARLKAIDEKILRAGAGNLKTTQDFVAFAAASARSGLVDQAQQVLQERQAAEPANPLIQRQLATVQSING